MAAVKPMIKRLRKSERARKNLINWQMDFIPGIYDDLFDKYHPSMLVSCTYGWRYDRYIIREAIQRKLEPVR